MTRRERLEAKVEKRGIWADKAAARSDARFDKAHSLAASIPMGQPILVGHHSERHARRDADRITSDMSKGVEERKLAEHHESKGRGLAIQLERTIFDDDPDAIERLEARIAEREKTAARMTEINKAWRKGGIEGVRAIAGDKLAEAAAKTMAQCPWLKSPLFTTGDRASIRGDKQRIEAIREKRDRAAKAEAAPGGLLIEGDTYVRVTFPEKPSREVLEALREASFRFSQGSWHGHRANLPAEVTALAAEVAA